MSPNRAGASDGDDWIPDIEDLAGWTLRFDPRSRPRDEAVIASLLTLGNGTMAVVGDVGPEPDGRTRFVLAQGAYGRHGRGLVRPLPGPAWTALTGGRGSHDRWILDLRTGTLLGHPTLEGVRTLRFVSLTHPHLAGLRAEEYGRDAWPPPLASPRTPETLSVEHRWHEGASDDGPWAETVSDRARIRVTARQQVWTTEERSRLERLVEIHTHADGQPADPDPPSALDGIDFDELLRDHRHAWTKRWEGADIEIDGDEDAQLAVRFALFHLLSCAPVEGEAAIGARGLTGLAYAGHVFWDTDVFVLPALAATLPGAARAAIEYRIARLPAARALAEERGLPGARYPWESADDGHDVTPKWVRDVEGRNVPVLTGLHAEHINSDVAWGLLHYVTWTGDDAVLTGAGRDLVLDTARHLAARIRTDADGHGHLYGVTGPDEYHEVVDDNAYTNGMARWHLLQAARLCASSGSNREADHLRQQADRLVTGFDPATRRHEQFTGFYGLEPLLLTDITEPPVAADVLLGRERVDSSQVIKQPDVLMLHHVLPDACPTGSLEADLDFYLPRTAHGSSLSPAICAALLARAGRPDDAMPLFDLAARLDLDDLTGTTAGGLHLATMGGVWQAVVHGFAGIRATAQGLHVDPHLPRRWSAIRIHLHYRGEPVRFDIDHERVVVETPRPVPVVLDGQVREAPLTARRTDLQRQP